MAVISGIVESAKREGRYVVEVDGKAFVTVSLDIIERLRLAIGVVVTEALEGALREEGAALDAYDRGLNMLAFQARSKRDLRRRLVQKGESDANAEAAVERLEAKGLVDDGAFARQFARSRVLGQGASRRRLQQELFKRGVERSVADEAIGEVLSEEAVDEGDVVERVARKKVRSLGGLDAATRRRRLYAFLARRGYDADVIRRAMAAVLEGGEGEGDEMDRDGGGAEA
jgi:regulatory protein